MRVERAIPEKTYFVDLGYGECFSYEEMALIKVGGEPNNAIDLETGCAHQIDYDACVERLNAKVVIE